MKAAALTLGLMLSIPVAACDAPAPPLRDQTPDIALAASAPVNDAASACAAATARVTAARGLPFSHVAVCDPSSEVPELPDYYVLALRAYCREDLCGSTNMGWFAVQKTTGDVFEIDDVGDWTLGRRVTGGA